MSTIIRTLKSENDGLTRTDWFPPTQQPTVPGEYEAMTGGGHVFRRKWTNHGWINSITGLVSKAELDWRGIVPGSVPPTQYPSALRDELAAGLALLAQDNWDKAPAGLDIPSA